MGLHGPISSTAASGQAAAAQPARAPVAWFAPHQRAAMEVRNHLASMPISAGHLLQHSKLPWFAGSRCSILHRAVPMHADDSCTPSIGSDRSVACVHQAAAAGAQAGRQPGGIAGPSGTVGAADAAQGLQLRLEPEEQQRPKPILPVAPVSCHLSVSTIHYQHGLETPAQAVARSSQSASMCALLVPADRPLHHPPAAAAHTGSDGSRPRLWRAAAAPAGHGPVPGYDRGGGGARCGQAAQAAAAAREAQALSRGPSKEGPIWSTSIWNALSHMLIGPPHQHIARAEHPADLTDQADGWPHRIDCRAQGIDNDPGVHPALQPRRRRGRPRTKGLPDLQPGQVMTLDEALRVGPRPLSGASVAGHMLALSITIADASSISHTRTAQLQLVSCSSEVCFQS